MHPCTSVIGILQVKLKIILDGEGGKMQNKQLLSGKISKAIARGVKDGFYTVGSKLPGEVELCDELHVSRATIREAIKHLESKNVLVIKRGVGTFVAEEPGLADDPLGLMYVDIDQETSRIFKCIKRSHEDLLENFLHLRSIDKKIILEVLSVKESSGLMDRIQTVFQVFELASKKLNLAFSYRHLKSVHAALNHMGLIQDKEETEHIQTVVNGFVDALESGSLKDMKTTYDMMMDAMIIELYEG